MQRAVRRAKLDPKEELQALRRLDRFFLPAPTGGQEPLP
jgi:hypothetical protein